LNRFLWFAVKRSNILPFGGCETPTETLAPRLEDAWKFAAGNELDGPQEVIMAEETKEMWPVEYRRLTEDREGLFGAVTSRSEAQVIRLALVYALLDSSYMIAPQHLKAALAVETYVEQSARHVFGNLTGNPITDEINSFLRNNPAGVTQTQISDYFSRNVTRDTLQRSLSDLLSTGKATKEEFNKPGPGRPTIMWRPILTEAKTD
jgi:hypothetical protein